MKSVLVVHPQFDVIGGAELVSLQVMQWLLSRMDARVTLLTLTPVNFDRVQRATGLRLSTPRLSVEHAKCPRFIREAEGKFTLLKLAFLHRAARRRSGDFELCIGTYGEIDFGEKGFQYIHHPLFAPRDFLNKYKIIPRKNILDLSSFLNGLYRKISFLVSGDTLEGFKKNITAVNSKFIQGLVRDVYGIESTVLYPGFLLNGDSNVGTKWEDRPFRFVAVGRIAPDKDYVGLLDVFKALSVEFPQARFLIVGKVGDSTYYAKLQKKARTLAGRLEIVTDASREELHALLRTSKFFIHGKEYEHFGIGILEATHAGCIPFVHDSGGQREIVTPQVLRYRTVDDIVVAVDRMCGHEEERDGILAELQASLSRFRKSSFMQALDRLLGPLLTESRSELEGWPPTLQAWELEKRG